MAVCPNNEYISLPGEQVSRLICVESAEEANADIGKSSTLRYSIISAFFIAVSLYLVAKVLLFTNYLPFSKRFFSLKCNCYVFFELLCKPKQLLMWI